MSTTVTDRDLARLIAGAYAHPILSWVGDLLRWEDHGTLSEAQTRRWILATWGYRGGGGMITYRGDDVVPARPTADDGRPYLRPTRACDVPDVVLYALASQLPPLSEAEARRILRRVRAEEADPRCLDRDLSPHPDSARRAVDRACLRDFALLFEVAVGGATPATHDEVVGCVDSGHDYR